MGYFCRCFSFEFWTGSWIARHHRVIFCLMVFKEGISVFSVQSVLLGLDVPCESERWITGLSAGGPCG